VPYLQDIKQYLTPEELDKANRFRFEVDKHRFQIARGITKRILSLYLGTSPSKLRLTYTAFGKPILADSFYISGLHFNVSHTYGLALCAITLGSAIGIDVEQLMVKPSKGRIC
jgi:4'-phosphopantetheinyl transferase